MRWKLIAPILFTFIIFFFIFSTVDIGEILDILLDADPYWLILAFIITISFPFLYSLRWLIVLRMMGAKVTYKLTTLVILGVLPMNSIIPSRGGDLIKAYFLKDKIRPSKLFGTVITERILDVLTLVSLAIIGSIAFDVSLYIIGFGISVILIIVMMVGLMVLFSRKGRLGKIMHNLLISLRSARKRPGTLLLVGILTIFIWGLSIFQTAIFFYAIGLDIAFPLLFAAVPVAIFVGLIPLTIAGMGTRDSALIYLLKDFAAAPQLAAVGILFSFFRYWLLAGLSLPFMFACFRRIKK